MRATKAGRVLGTALEDMNVEGLGFCPDDTEGKTSRRCGEVLVFVNLVDYSGVSLSVLMNEKKEIALASGLQEEVVTLSETVSPCDALSGVATTTDEFATSTELILDNPCVQSVNELALATSTQTTTSAPVVIDTDLEILEFLREYKISVDADSALSSEIFTDRINAGIEIFSPRIVANGLRVETLDALGEQIRINPDVVFFGRPYFTTDTAGFAVVKKGSDSVFVSFDRAYLEKPIINASMATSDGIESSPESALAIRALLGKDIRFLVGQATTTGFTIFLNKVADEDIMFNWMAIAVKGARTFESDPALFIESNPVVQPQVGTTTPSVEEIQSDQTEPVPEEDTQEVSDTASDTEAPVITINGNNPAVIDLGASYNDIGATVTDNVNTNLGITVSGDQIDTSVAGTYTVTYTATDQAGNSVTATRTVIVGQNSVENNIPEAPEELEVVDVPVETVEENVESVPISQDVIVQDLETVVQSPVEEGVSDPLVTE
jgi:hypothetical protein